MVEQTTITEAEAKEQMRSALRMTASLYRHFAGNIVAALGEEAGKKLILQAINDFGSERGTNQRRLVEQLVSEVEPENYMLNPDLPKWGWEVSPADDPVNQTHIRITTCPLAQYWLEHDCAELGRLYCHVDQAKYQAFHPEADFVQTKSVLTGDKYCEMFCRKLRNK